MGWQVISPWRLLKALTVAIGVSSATSAAFDVACNAIMISATADCHVRIGMSPTAVTTDTLIRSAFPPLIFKVAPGEQIAVIQDSGAGTLYVTELTH